MGKRLEFMRIGYLFLNSTPMAYAQIIDKWKQKVQSFYNKKDIFNRTKWQPTDWEKNFINPTANRGLIYNLYKELKKFDLRPPNIPIKNGVQRLKKEFSTEET